MRNWILAAVIVGTAFCSVGCGGGPVVNVPGMKQNQKDRNKANSSNVKDQTGVDLGTATPVKKKGKLNLTTAPIE